MKRTGALATTTLLLAGCGGGIPAELAVAPLGQAAHTQSQSLRVADGHWGSEGTDGFAYAQLDALKLEVQSLGLETTSGSRLSVSVDEVVELRPGMEQVPFSAQVTVPPGDFREARLVFDSSYEVKAHCRTATHLVYTTAAEVRRLDCAVEDCEAGLPTDYDFYRYEFIYVTTDDGPNATGDRAQEETLEPFSISITGAPRLAVLVDTSYLVACYDGTSQIGGPGHGLAPFSFHPSGASDALEFFPSGAPAFGIGYLPLFVWVTDDPAEALPVGETYAAAPDASMLEADELDMSPLLVTTLAFRDDGSPLAARARNFDRSSVNLNQYFSGFERDAEGRLSFFNGEFYWDDQEPGRFVQDRHVAGFERTALGAPAFETLLGDGPECGATLMTEHGNSARECMREHDQRSIWWKRIHRL